MISAEMGEHRIRAIHNRIVFRPSDEHLHAFLLNDLRFVFGEEWWAEQTSRGPDARHAIMRWVNSIAAWKEQNFKGLRPTDIVPSSGDVREIMSLAADLHYLQLVNQLPASLVKRLRSFDQFQGGRYELAVASSLVRVGFDIDWNAPAANAASGSAKRHEFDAIHKLTGETIAVECKSRHRLGTINQGGERPDLSSVNADIFRLFNEAMEQDPADRPFAVFIDINLPHPEDVPLLERGWITEILDKLEAKGEATFGRVLPTFLTVTNSAWHYEGHDTAQPAEMLRAMPINAPFTLKHAETIRALGRLIGVFSAIPPG
jgi:hypothetical protein